MPLYIRDDDVDLLASELKSLLGARTKTDAVRQALRQEIERAREAVPLRERIEAAKRIARKIGPPRRNFDMKAFTDEMWGE